MTTKILDRIRKLLELANSSNEHEAANAAGVWRRRRETTLKAKPGRGGAGG